MPRAPGVGYKCTIYKVEQQKPEKMLSGRLSLLEGCCTLHKHREMLFSFSGPAWELSQLALHTYFLVWRVRTTEPLVKNGWSCGAASRAGEKIRIYTSYGHIKTRNRAERGASVAKGLETEDG